LQIAQALNCVNMRFNSGAVRGMHWHKPDEWGFVIKGRMRVKYTTLDCSHEGATGNSVPTQTKFDGIFPNPRSRYGADGAKVPGLMRPYPSQSRYWRAGIT
jgi:hypothetical protein